MKTCDFCSNPTPVVEYPAHDIILAGIMRSTGSWFACAGCQALIEAGSYDALVVNGIARMREKPRIAGVPEHLLAEWVRTSFDGFRRARYGPAIPVRAEVAQ